MAQRAGCQPSTNKPARVANAASDALLSSCPMPDAMGIQNERANPRRTGGALTRASSFPPAQRHFCLRHKARWHIACSLYAEATADCVVMPASHSLICITAGEEFVHV